MRRYQSEFKCVSDKCEAWISSFVVIAESENEYEGLRQQLPVPFGEWDNGDLTTQHDCDVCGKKLNLILVKKDFRSPS